eukprot:2451527-Pyramimonas_sp.AAC.1
MQTQGRVMCAAGHRRNQSCTKSAEKFKALNQAYDVLKDGSKRTLYDINIDRPPEPAGTSTRTTQAQWEQNVRSAWSIALRSTDSHLKQTEKLVRFVAQSIGKGEAEAT